MIPWRHLIGLWFIAGLWAFLFWAFSGKIQLTDSTVSALVGATVMKLLDIVSVIVTHYYDKGRTLESMNG